MECRPGCGACCTVISISSPIPGMPEGKPAGIPCLHLTAGNRCGLYGQPGRPEVCSSLRPSEDMCGSSDEEAYAILKMWEEMTKPSAWQY
ncbi:YkgJ family cysteine cluster protein [Paenibacillus puerhi]|uniref:YkgJ family cysteine cluster protein n=1 Tax=Paenibacillus puerhi TaxID=2692622 RepID=UPI001359D67B|nr:YkgJ family cysteine cluster protein [Paenibacillus puerhi]